MERMWRKVNQGLSSRNSLSKSAGGSTTNAAVASDTASSAGFGDPQVVVAVVGSSSNVSGNVAIASNTTTGRRLASSGQQHSTLQHRNTSFSQHVISTASSDRRRKRRRKSRPRRNGERSATGFKNDQLFQPSATCSLGVPSTVGKPQFQNQSGTNTSTLATVGNIPGPSNFAASSTGTTSAGTVAIAPSTINNVANAGSSSGTGDPSLRQRAVAKLRLFNFHLNWDLHMTQCKPCGPRSSGNILTRRLCRNRRREDNELYRSNSFKFERFERKEFSEAGTDTLQKQISVCDDYSLPIDFVKKRPSSFDPCLAETIKDSWIAPSPSSDHVKFLDQPAILAHSANVVKLVEAYSDPKDSRKLSKNHRKNRNKEKKSTNSSGKTAYNSADSSAPKSSADDENQSIKVPELNSPDSISEDLVRPLQTHKSPKRVTGPDTSKRNPSPYYYSDLLKSKEDFKEPKLRARQSTVSEPLPLLQSQPHILAYKKSSSLDVPDIEREVHPPKRYSITEDGVRIIRCDSPSTTTSDDSDCSECRKRREWHVKALALVRETCNISVTTQLESNLKENNIDSTQIHTSMPPHRLLGPAVCACAAPALGDDIDEFFRPRSIFYVHQQGIHECIDCSTTIGSDKSTNTGLHEDEMSSGRTRKIYETAFDCKISRSDDDLDEVDRFNSHSVLLQINNGNSGAATSNTTIGAVTTATTPGKIERPKSNKSRIEVKRMKSSKSQISQDSSTNISTLSHELENVHIDSNLDNANNANTTSISQLPIRGYTPSPPSTAPLPVKFPGKHDRYFMNSIKSAPNLPSSNPAHPRLKDLRLPVQTVRHQHEVPAGKDGCILDTTYNSQRTHERPRSIVLESGRVLELRKSHHGNHQRGRNFSSTESMATSSSGGSMESLRSSTSEGNRSTTSSESRHSTSLSSHSSDSGHSVAFPLRAPVVLHSKLHILSPISDKSSQEPASETSDVNNKNNNSQKVSPDENTKPIFDHSEDLPTDVQKQPKRRTLPNKAILHLTDEILGSDSGISLHSREDGKPQNVFHKFALPNINIPSEKESANVGSSGGLPQDLRDLPFDMPKLRRRKQTLQQDPFTSGSATSVDLGDLPFDMPKLRRRLRMNQPQVSNILIHSTESSGISQASSSHSVRDENKQTTTDPAMFRQNLTLNLSDSKPPNKFGSLDLKASSSRGLNLNLGNSGLPMAVDIIDISLPLERQGWYHGAITRVEAESTLRQLNEGSFLVRNCESTKQDYSLSLKSAKGFMHMRIQRNDAGRYILGQFSRPFESIPEMIRHFCLNRLPVRGAEHMCLLEPVIAQLL